MERWLSLTVLDRKNPENRGKTPPFFISVPKKIVRRAVRRNRIKRVLREALRHETLLQDGKTYTFKVVKAPETVDLKVAKQAVHELLH